MEEQRKIDDNGRTQIGCGVNSTLNFTVGGVSIVAALLIGYLVYVYWLK
jgi:hypothetical protein